MKTVIKRAAGSALFAGVMLCVVTLTSEPAVAAPFTGPVDRAVCGPGSMPETGIQGHTRSATDVASGRAQLGFTCNLEQLGHEGKDAQWQMAWYGDCAYYGRVPNQGGVVVVDASDPANPVRSAVLNTASLNDPWESLKVNQKRGLLAGVGAGAASVVNFDLYNVKDDCAHPVGQTYSVNTGVGHEGEWMPDGLRYVASGFLSPELTVINTENPTMPLPWAKIAESTHGLSFSDDGNRAYLASWAIGANGVVILDTTAIQAKVPGATSAKLGAFTWSDGGVAQMTIPVTIKGKPYLIFIDEGSQGMARILDISNEQQPFLVANLRDEINMAANSALRSADGGTGFAYQGHYCGVPRRDEPEVVACSYFWQGVRVFDIRDPTHPKEIAYFVPPSTGTTRAAMGQGASAKVRFVKRKGRAEIWFTIQADHAVGAQATNKGGFYIAKFTNGAWPFGTADILTDVTPALVEGGAANFGVKLGQQPNGVTVVSLTPSAGMTVSPTTLTYNRANYDVPQPVTVSSNTTYAPGAPPRAITAKVISEGGLPCIPSRIPVATPLTPCAENPDETGVAYDLARDPHYMDNGGVTRDIVSLASDDALLNFIERANVAPSTFVTTESKPVCCYAGSLPISVSNGQYSINGGPFTTSAGSVASGSKLVLRHLSAAANNVATVTTVTVGGYSAPFRSTTTSLDRTPDAFDFGTVSGAAASTLVQSGTQTLTGFNTGTPIVAGPGVSYSIDGGAFTSATGTLQPGQMLQVQQTSSGTHLAYTKGYVKVGGVYGYFTTRTQ